MTEIELTEDEQMTFSVLFGTLFSLDLALNYIDGLQPILISKRANYCINKNREAEQAINKLNAVISREFYKSCTWEQQQIFMKAIDVQKNLVYGIMGLDPDKQDKVRDLVTKLMEES